MKNLLTLFFFCSLVAFGQSNSPLWTTKPFSNLGFTENLDRFDEVMNEDVLYYTDYMQYRLFFSKDAFIFGRPETLSPKEQEELEEMLEKGEQLPEIQWHYFKINFENTTNDVELIPFELKSHTRNYRDDALGKTIKARSFDKLIYKGIYPHIDLVVELPEEGGLKYNFIVHPGGNYRDIEMAYSGVDLTLNEKGDLSLAGEYHHFLDKAPESFSNGEMVKSQYQLTDNKVSFEVFNFDPTKELIIDPWIVSDLPIEFDPYSRAYEIGYDNEGNCMILGNASNRVAMYDNTGTLQWVWEYAPITSSTGDLATNPITGDSFFPLALGGPTIKLDVTGVEIDSDPTVFGTDPPEKWRAIFNEVENELILGNGGTSGDSVLTRLSEDFTSELHYEVLPAPLGEIRDVVFLEIDPDGSAIYFSIAAEVFFGGTSPYDNHLYKVDYDNPNEILWETPTEFGFTEVGSVTYGPPVAFAPNGFNGIACGTNYLYTYDGRDIRRIDKFTGDFIAGYTVVEDVPYSQGGIDIDECDNVYVGTADSILIFNEELELVDGYELPGACYDMVIGNDLLYACGDGFVGEFELIGEGSGISLSSEPATCEVCNGTATVSVESCGIVDVVPESIVWSPGGLTDETITGLCPGWYVATVTILDLEGDPVVFVDSVEVISEEIDLTVTELVIDEACTGSCNGEATFTPTSGTAPYSFDLEGDVNTTGIFTGLCSGTHDITVTDDNGCTYTGTITVESGIGLGLEIVTFNEPSCYGFTDGSITVETGGGLEDVTYEWTPSNPVPGPTFNTLGAGTYKVVASTDGCIDSLEITLNEPDSLWASLSTTDLLCYGDSSGIAVVDSVYNAQGDLNNITFVWSPNPFGSDGVGVDSAYNLYSGQYVLTITDDNGCSNTVDFTINSPDELVFAELGTEPSLCRVFHYQSGSGVVFAAASGGTGDYDYQWVYLDDPEENTNNSTWGGRNPGTYEITVTDDNGCVLTEIVELDSLTPKASFDVVSDQLDENCEGTELVEAQFINTSEDFSNTESDTTFQWSLDYPNSEWIITHDYYYSPDTNYVGEAIYEVCLIAINANGCVDTTCKDLIVHVQPTFTAPNIFTPGNGGGNDLFTFEFLTEGIETFHCVIVNRWGKKVAELNNIADGWDGTDFGGDDCTAGVYFYTYNAISTNGTAFTGQGNLQLVRE